jgi:CBS domain-containing protein
MRHLSRRALDEKPPTGFFRDLVVRSKGEHAGTLDIKHGGIVLIGNLARAYAVGSGIVERQTLRRLRAAAEAGRITNDERQSLEEAFRLLWAVRLDHQVRCVREGRPPDDFVDPKTLGPLTRGGLKDAFRIIAAQQRVLAADLGVNLR